MKKPTRKQTLSGGKHISQRDAMEKAMDAAYKNTKVYGLIKKKK